MLWLPVSISLLAFSAPITAAIITKKKNGCVQIREYDAFKREIGDQITGINGKLDTLIMLVQR